MQISGTIFKKDGEQSQRLKKIVARFSAKYNVPVDFILLAWILKHPSNIFPVCGTADPARIANLMKATTVEMELQDCFVLWTESTGLPVS